MFVLFF